MRVDDYRHGDSVLYLCVLKTAMSAGCMTLIVAVNCAVSTHRAVTTADVKRAMCRQTTTDVYVRNTRSLTHCLSDCTIPVTQFTQAHGLQSHWQMLLLSVQLIRMIAALDRI